MTIIKINKPKMDNFIHKTMNRGDENYTLAASWIIK